MATISCQNCQRANPAGKAFCQYCGRRLVAAPADVAQPPLEASAPAEEQLTAALDSLAKSKQAAQEFSDKLAESSRVIGAQKHELDVAKSQIAELSAEDKRKQERLAAGEQAVAALKKELDTARERAGTDQTRMKESLAESQQMIATLKQQFEVISAKLTDDQAPKITQGDSSIDELKKKLDAFADLVESKLTQAGVALPSNPSGMIQNLLAALGGKRKFGVMAMAIASTLFAGAGGVGGFFLQPEPEPKLDESATVRTLQGRLTASENKVRDTETTNLELQKALRSHHAAYERLEQDLNELKSRSANVAPSANPAAAPNDQLQLQLTSMERQLAEERAAHAELERKLGASGTELEQYKQRIATQEQTIARLNEQLRGAREARPEPRPKSKKASDFEFNVRELREYGRELGIPNLGR